MLEKLRAVTLPDAKANEKHALSPVHSELEVTKEVTNSYKGILDESNWPVLG